MARRTFDPDGFTDRLRQEAADTHLARRVTARLEPLLTALATREYAPGIATDVRTHAILGALTAFTGQTQHSVSLYSVQEPVACPAWMTEEMFRQRFGDNEHLMDLASCLSTEFPDEFSTNYWKELETPPSFGWIVEEIDRLDVLGLSSVILGTKSVPKISEIVRSSLVLPITAAAYCAATGDAERYDRLDRLLRELRVTIPLGIKKDEDDTWICLVS